ncbi:hypothetical protein Misp01_36930 [Microtetraspora sp. NBRC 13810]|uniref:hypothetical protein n=1 Tax=Microtetraspora sp. NBRC 13810 TaxID=3030990 RepID=UPI0024A30470|nr:hypothetical protein [Microtetraspora sp. NBRC 13810]GLW08563.1 hypothetical protein Misp01_36930 [Microtetraspora sp. NBRC 13810]
MQRRLVLAVTGWIATAALATGAGVGVIGLLGESFSDPAGRPLSAEDVRRELAATPSPPARPVVTPSLPATPAPAASGAVSDVISTEGGTVVARCEGGLVTLRSWTPAQGYQVDDVERGPAGRARVEFEAEETDVKLEVHCGPGNRPVHRVHLD